MSPQASYPLQRESSSGVGSPRSRVAALTGALAMTAGLSQPASAGGSADALGGFSQAAAEIVGYSVETSARAIANALSIEYAVPAVLDKGSSETSAALNERVSRPLPIDAAVYTIGPPPAEALKHE